MGLGIPLTKALERAVSHGAQEAVATKTWDAYLRNLIKACGTPGAAAQATYAALLAITPAAEVELEMR